MSARDRQPPTDADVLRCGLALWGQNAGKLWTNIDSTERVLMAYARPGAAWRASDDALKPFSTQGAHHAHLS